MGTGRVPGEERPMEEYAKLRDISIFDRLSDETLAELATALSEALA